jgi:steroid 5-alpha reductase family enzyme
MDIAYGPVYLIATVATAHLTGAFGLLPTLASTLVALWSVRLCLRIFHKNYSQPEDARYAAWRAAWQEKGQLYFIFRSYLQVFVLQGAIITFVSLPIVLAIANPFSYNLWFIVFGCVIWLIGFSIETVADWQLDNFIARKKSGEETASLMTTGLFKYSRRPNYFGETLIWWGLAIMTLPFTFGYIGIISPLLITYIVTKVTGPMLENMFLKKYGAEYRAYQKKTSYFIPLPSKI